ncbi:hypothetical protein NBRC110019_05040 [Neptunitalea chrysea]|uniref:HMA domain-containing protein n=1 Tax=Neptunitalea chrysea TaxID=1647581 RepID=A0A9W6B4I1_9FLAO|nr:heavy metal-associated domain-containing protein [Neptunitalea chrysea]GLB51465.1 hypothetical protein NBRC110019_05040 [Neptunitalea chrysea]
MKHTYKVTGMTCMGCSSFVERALNDLEGVTKAAVDLEKAEAQIEMTEHIPIETLQKEIGTHYHLHTSTEEAQQHKEASKKK